MHDTMDPIKEISRAPSISTLGLAGTGSMDTLDEGLSSPIVEVDTDINHEHDPIESYCRG